MRHRTIVAVAFACAASVAVLAQQGQSRPGEPQQPPSRDTSAQIRRGTGTASITGQVVALDTGRPLKRARVSLNAAELPEGRSAVTDEQGRYSFQNLPAGRYNISVSKPGFIGLAWGARRPGRAGRPFPLADGERARGADFMLPRGSVVTGHVYDEDGEPMVGAQVRAMRFQYMQGEKRLIPAGSSTSDDRGEFRIFSLQPGIYYVAATSTQTGSMNLVESGEGMTVVARYDGVNYSVAPPAQAAATGFAPTYYPGVTAVADALPVNVGLQAEAGNVDFVLQLVPTARVSGTVMLADGSPAAGGSLTLSPDDGTNSARYLGANYGSGIRPDGSFMIMNVPPGRYIAFARGQDRRAREPLFAMQNVSVSGADVTGVALTLAPGQTVSGTVTIEAGSSAASLGRVRVSVTPLSSLPIPTPPASGALLDGSFSLTPVVAGNYLVRVSGLPQNFALKAAYYGGRDVADLPLEVRAGQNIGGMNVVISDRVTEISGTVPDADGQLVLDYTVVAFSTDASNWRPQSRFIQTGRPDAGGQFRIRGLPPGDYMVVALDDVETGEWFDPAFLDSARRSAVRVSLGDGDAKTLELKLATLGR
jgi:protocatechuate 3,4-dioxygenase beta subunit